MKPSWLSWGEILWLPIQAILASLLIYVTISNWLGLRKPLPSEHPHTLGFEIGILVVAMLALVATFGILRNRWWGFFCELAVLWGFPLAIYADTGRVPLFPLLSGFPASEWFSLFLTFTCFIMWNFELLNRGMLKYEEQLAETNA